MSDQTALWLLFALLSVALVLVVITARRGPWQNPPADEPEELFLGVVVLRPAVDPLWGKNRPESWS